MTKEFTMTNTIKPLWAVVLSASLATPLALAQGSGAAKSLGGGQGAGPIMTRDELRTCMRQQETMTKRRTEMEAERKALDAEKAEILAETDAIKGTRGDVNQANVDIADINKRTEALSRRIEEWNANMKDLESSGRSGPMADRQRRALEREKREIETESDALDAERSKLGGVRGDATKFNERAAALEARVRTWNERNAKAAQASEKAVHERDLWISECGNRRYLIEDEAAIRKGQ